VLLSEAQISLLRFAVHLLYNKCTTLEHVDFELHSAVCAFTHSCITPTSMCYFLWSHQCQHNIDGSHSLPLYIAYDL